MHRLELCKCYLEKWKSDVWNQLNCSGIIFFVSWSTRLHCTWPASVVWDENGGVWRTRYVNPSTGGRRRSASGSRLAATGRPGTSFDCLTSLVYRSSRVVARLRRYSAMPTAEDGVEASQRNAVRDEFCAVLVRWRPVTLGTTRAGLRHIGQVANSSAAVSGDNEAQ